MRWWWRFVFPWLRWKHKWWRKKQAEFYAPYIPLVRHTNDRGIAEDLVSIQPNKG